MVTRKPREDMGNDGSLGKVWESVSGNNKENADGCFNILRRPMRRAEGPFAGSIRVFENTDEGIGGRIRSLSVSRRPVA